ncbi:MAG: Rieske 2Fe-2S domain-containing protein [Planctomyces sp.]|nr:Rieske 2Fe-2S domain-containing protein [Planctomyces sp.]
MTDDSDRAVDPEAKAKRGAGVLANAVEGVIAGLAHDADASVQTAVRRFREFQADMLPAEGRPAPGTADGIALLDDCLQDVEALPRPAEPAAQLRLKDAVDRLRPFLKVNAFAAPEEMEPGHRTRRLLLKGLLGLLGATLSGVVAIPTLVAAISPAIRRRTGPQWRRVGRADAFPHGDVTKAVIPVGRGDWSRSLEEKAVYVWRRGTGDEDFVVYSRNCTDLSCPVTYDRGSACFYCPCHGGIFAQDGRPLAGPPRVPLYRYAIRVRGGNLELDLASLPSVT